MKSLSPAIGSNKTKLMEKKGGGEKDQQMYYQYKIQ